ncbi:MAG: TolC family protein [Gemmatimonadota bacterium]|jgi:outer membrane protein|nr:TolC family protein [Gemmatimonadota bacterium]MDQ8151075.1 TolC family protein [Gemmatimonadota bacterium]MDQ8152802.1 TolC family protein [Gemmatimonadota bacterium]MDQ8170647.1 TolC family protein [Gemmatimonadota bacterium]MDQ8175632.1 TolC family protein [Gemmatimonadota bacterium]
MLRKVRLMVVCLPMALGAQETARPITLDEAVRLAKRNAPAAVQARNAVRQQAGTVRTRYAAYLPTLSFGAGANRQNGTRYLLDLDTILPNDVPWRANHSLSSNLEVFDGGRRWFELQAARAGVDAAEASEVAQEFTVSLTVKQQFYAVLAAREQQSAAAKQLEQAAEQLKAANARVGAGAATRSDSLRSVIAVGNARLAVLAAENALAGANASLSRLVGSPTLVTAAPDDQRDAALRVTRSDAELLALAEQGPAVRQAIAAADAAKQNSRAAKTPYLPTLSLGLSQSYAASQPGFALLGDNRNKNIATNLRVNFTVFNGLNREQQVLQASLTEQNAQAALRDAKLNARQLMIQQLGTLRTAEARVEIQQQSVLAGEEDLRVQQERYNLGAGTLLDLLASQSTLISARQALIQARLDARTARAQIEALIGRDL